MKSHLLPHCPRCARRYWLLIGMALVVGSLGCGPGESRAPNSKQTNRTADETEGGQAAARAALQTALESWKFGDSQEKFEREHPDIHFGDFDQITSRLLRYEIGTYRKSGNVHQFHTELTLSGLDGQVHKTKVYSVIRDPKGKWGILGAAN